MVGRRRYALRAGLLGGLLVALGAAPAEAVEFKIRGETLRLDLTESLFLAAHLDDGTPDPTTKNYGELLNKLNAQLAWRRFLLSVRFDSGAWVNAPQVGDHSSYVSPPGAPVQLNCKNPQSDAELSACVARASDLKNRFVDGGQVVSRFRDKNGYQMPLGVAAFYLEKFSLAYSGRSVEFTLGDFYANIGRGLILSIRKIDELGVDTTITGAKLIVHEKGWNLVALAGFTNTQNIDPTRAQFVDDSNDLVAALSASYRIADRVTLGVHNLFGSPMTCPQNANCARSPAPFEGSFDYVLRPGFLVDAPRLLRWLGVYFEYARQEDRKANQMREANALYGAATVYTGRVSWLLEGKWYFPEVDAATGKWKSSGYEAWHATNDPFGTAVYMVPPTLEQVITQINNNTNIAALRLRADLRVSSTLNLFYSAQVGQSRTGDGDRPSDHTTNELYDFYGGAELRWNHGASHFFPILGYRHERETPPPATATATGSSPYTAEQLVSLSWDATQDLGKRFSLEASGLIWFREKGLESVPGSRDNQWVEGNIYLALKWSPRFVLGAGYEFTTDAGQKYNQHDFFNGSFVWNITSGTSIQLFGGGNRPGLRCVSGVCRVFPAFQGVRLEVVVRY